MTSDERGKTDTQVYIITGAQLLRRPPRDANSFFFGRHGMSLQSGVSGWFIFSVMRSSLAPSDPDAICRTLKYQYALAGHRLNDLSPIARALNSK
jgi:hypothetical protein